MEPFACKVYDDLTVYSAKKNISYGVLFVTLYDAIKYIHLLHGSVPKGENT